ncbi:hypothetical protein DFH09DRAFT_1313719 [Mycena vulgaris]|nr:hypothetical protein DFH09DRAFT_1313719 [Mycena vulgaris]
MATLTRFPKSANEWTVNELLAYRISIKLTSPDEFFSSAPEAPMGHCVTASLDYLGAASLDHLDPAILTAPRDAHGPELSDPTAQYLGHLHLATKGAAQE